MAKRLALIYLIPALWVLVVGHNQKYKTTLIIFAVLVSISSIKKDWFKDSDVVVKVVFYGMLGLLTLNNVGIIRNEYSELIDNYLITKEID